MSKVIKVTEEELNKLKEEFAKALEEGKWPDGRVEFKSNLGTIDRKATVYFSDLAWRKMWGLVQEFSDEVAWHGVARRGENDDYFIDDIVVYPQEVNGTTVTADQEAYDKWLISLDDNTFNSLRFHGHSHVNMGTSPSGTDWDLRRKILQGLSDEDFYIFNIWNKSKSKDAMIYDMGKNVLFETNDIEVKILDESGYETFIKEAKDTVKKKTTTYSYNYAGTAVKSAAATTKESEKSKKKESKNTKYTPAYSYGWDGRWDDDWDDEYSYYGYGKRGVYR